MVSLHAALPHRLAGKNVVSQKVKPTTHQPAVVLVLHEMFKTLHKT